jgi:hypothetical protein
MTCDPDHGCITCGDVGVVMRVVAAGAAGDGGIADGQAAVAAASC